MGNFSVVREVSYRIEGFEGRKYCIKAFDRFSVLPDEEWAVCVENLCAPEESFLTDIVTHLSCPCFRVTKVFLKKGGKELDVEFMVNRGAKIGEDEVKQGEEG